jgi:hypothetical protein
MSPRTRFFLVKVYRNPHVNYSYLMGQLISQVAGTLVALYALHAPAVLAGMVAGIRLLLSGSLEPYLTYI